MIKTMIPKKRPSPLRSRSEEEDFGCSLPSLTVEAFSSPQQESKSYLEKPARKVAKSCSFDLEVNEFSSPICSFQTNFVNVFSEKLCELFPDVVDVSKRREPLQLRWSDKKNKSRDSE